MQNPKLGDDGFIISTTYCNDHDWGDSASYDRENLFEPHDEYVIDIAFAIILKVSLEERQL